MGCERRRRLGVTFITGLAVTSSTGEQDGVRSGD